jgi:hypothetical protein
MARPVKSRNVKAYSRDIEQLNRLRVAIMMDTSIDSGKAKELQAILDSLIAELIQLARGLAA